MPDNTAESWASALLALADEAAGDAKQRDTSLALTVTLNDLSAILRSYAGRLDVERLPVAPDESDAARLQGAQAAPAVPVPAPVTDLPDRLAAALRDLDERVAALEARANFTVITPAPAFAPNTVLVIDDDPGAWDSIERARAALRSMVVREHGDRARIRQSILERVAALARTPDLATNSAAQAELRQHEHRAQELAEIDAIAGVKMDQIAALDDLELARTFNVKDGWPS